tara:strand:+ start:2310 stop:2468 length:159 start_codon:yes stop_codon:yes gene_type:complete
MTKLKKLNAAADAFDAALADADATDAALDWLLLVLLRMGLFLLMLVMLITLN